MMHYTAPGSLDAMFERWSRRRFLFVQMADIARNAIGQIDRIAQIVRLLLFRQQGVVFNPLQAQIIFQVGVF